MKKLLNIIVYETEEPVIYNEGTEWESTETEFLAYYTYKSRAESEAEAERLTREVKEWNGRKVKRFWVEQQEEMVG